MIKFLKSALVNGLAILLPVVLVFLGIKEVFAAGQYGNPDCRPFHYLDVTLDEFSLVLTHLGTGLSDLLPKTHGIPQAK